MMIFAQESRVHRHIDQLQPNLMALPPINEQCLILRPKFSISPTLSYWQMGLANMPCWICHNVTQDIFWGFSAVPEIGSYASKCCSIAMNQESNFSYPDPATQYCLDSICWHMGLATLHCSSCHNETHVIGRGFSGVPEIGWNMLFHSYDFEMHTWPQVSSEPQIHTWCKIRRPSLHHSQNLTMPFFMS